MRISIFFVVLADIHRLQVTAQAGDEHLDLAREIVRHGVDFFRHRRPPGIKPFGHHLFERDVTVALAHRTQRAGNPVAIQVVHGDELVVHPLRKALGLLGVAGVNLFQHAVERAPPHLAQLVVVENTFRTHGQQFLLPVGIRPTDRA